MCDTMFVDFLITLGDFMKFSAARLSGNAIKFIAAFCMLCDHMGVILFPQYKFLRIIGRIAFPIFAFMIAEGCRYTKNKLKHFLTVGGFALAIQLGFFIFNKEMALREINVFVTFTFSIMMIYALQAFYENLFDKEAKIQKKILSGAVFLALVMAVYYVSFYINFDYNFYGAMIPVIASLFMMPKNCSVDWLKKLDNKYMHILMLGIGVALMVFPSPIKYKRFALLSLFILLFYSGKRGKLKTKYFFYVFYPLHLVILEGIYILMHI